MSILNLSHSDLEVLHLCHEERLKYYQHIRLWSGSKPDHEFSSRCEYIAYERDSVGPLAWLIKRTRFEVSNEGF